MPLGRLISRLLPGTTSVGLEISDHAVTMAEVAARSDAVTIHAISSTDLPPGIVTDGKIAQPAALAEALWQTWSRLGTRNRKLHLSVPSESVMVRFLKLPDLPEKELRRVVEFELKHHIHLPFDNPYFDFLKWPELEVVSSAPAAQAVSASTAAMAYTREAAATAESSGQEADPIGKLLGLGSQRTTPSGSGNANGSPWSASPATATNSPTAEQDDQPAEAKLSEVMLAAAPSDWIDSYAAAVRGAGLEAISIEIKAFTLFRLVERTGPVSPEDTFVLVDAGETMTDLCVYHAGRLRISRSVPVAFHSRSTENESLFRSACSELGHELERLLNFYRYTLNNRTQEFSRIVLSGDVSRLELLSGLLGDRLPIPVSLLPDQGLTFRRPADRFSYPAAATAIGLGLRGGQR